MADMITRCPKCSTAFRISEDLIKSAKGTVRCGSCLNVFNAKEYLVTTGIKKKNNTSKASSRPMSQVISDLEKLAKTTQSAHKSATTEQAAPQPSTKLKKPQIISPKEATKLKKPNNEGTPLFERSDESNQEQEDSDAAVDEAWALELLKNEEHEEAAKLNTSTKKEDDVELDSETNESRTQANEPTESKASEHPKDQAKAVPKSTEQNAPDKQNQTNIAQLAVSTDENIEKQNEPEALINSIAAIELEPLDSLLKERQMPLFKRMMWYGLTAAALLVLVGQVLWLQFYRLNQDEPYRSVYSVACKLLTCELPELLDRSKIQTSNLIIRTHPDEENALIVDVIIKNNAHFEQRFPDLRLTFTNLKNQVMASRKLSPKKYLGGELTGRTMMPKDQAIHIGIEIVDPGPLAVSYNIAVEN